MKVTCSMCEGTGEYWLAKGVVCKTCEGTGKIEIASPTTESSEPWLVADGRSGDLYGKWLLYVDKSKVDILWEKIRQETLNKKLGVGAKVTTKKGWVSRGMPEDYLICVYTNDDKKEISRVRDRLRELGFTKQLGYKTNVASMQGSDELLLRE